MSFIVNTEALKRLASLKIELDWAEKIGIQIFNNVGQEAPQYKNLCAGLIESCDKLLVDLSELKKTVTSYLDTKPN